MIADEQAFCAAMEFMFRLVRTVGPDLARPYINLCRDGSIDISWRKGPPEPAPKDARLLLNFSNKNGKMTMSWYGDDYGEQETQGTIMDVWDEGLAVWISIHMKEETNLPLVT